MTATEQHVTPEQCCQSPKRRTSWHDDCWRHRRGAFNNQQGWEAATEGSGGGADGRTMMVIYWTGATKRSGWDSAMLSRACSAAGSGTAPPLPPSTKTMTEGGPTDPALCRHGDNNDGDDDRIAHDNQIDGGLHGPLALCLTGPNCHNRRRRCRCCQAVWRRPQMHRHMHLLTPPMHQSTHFCPRLRTEGKQHRIHHCSWW